MRNKATLCILISILTMTMTACATSYKAKPLPFKAPESFQNMKTTGGAKVAARAFSDKQAAAETFGFDVIGAGMLPVQVVFDNLGAHPLEINAEQTFLEDEGGNLWPVLSRDLAYERATKYSKTETVFKKGAYTGFLGAAAGGIIGAAVGIVTGEGFGTSVGKGAAVGAAAGAAMGGAGAYGTNEPQRAIIQDLKSKSLENKAVQPNSIAHGFLFYPAEAGAPKQLRLQLKETDTGEVHVLNFSLGPGGIGG